VCSERPPGSEVAPYATAPIPQGSLLHVSPLGLTLEESIPLGLTLKESTRQPDPAPKTDATPIASPDDILAPFPDLGPTDLTSADPLAGPAAVLPPPVPPPVKIATHSDHGCF
jgi:hypothetical protein